MDNLKVYEVNFKQSFEETRSVVAANPEEAESKVEETWGSGADLTIFSITETSDTTEGYEDTLGK